MWPSVKPPSKFPGLVARNRSLFPISTVKWNQQESPLKTCYELIFPGQFCIEDCSWIKDSSVFASFSKSFKCSSSEQLAS